MAAGALPVCLALQRSAALPADAFVATHKGNALLHIAAGAGKLSTVEWLLNQSGCNVNASTQSEQLSALHCGVFGGQAAVVSKLLGAGGSNKGRCAL